MPDIGFDSGSSKSIVFYGGRNNVIKDMKLTITVADDEVIQRKVLSDIVHKITPLSEIITCSNGKEVYEVLQEKVVNIIITDIRMPVMDGMELIQKVSEEFPEIKVILVSAYQEFEYAKHAITYHVIDYLIKPFRVEAVKNVLKKVYEDIKVEQEQNTRLKHYQILSTEAKKLEINGFLNEVLSAKYDNGKLELKEFEFLRKSGLVGSMRWLKHMHLNKNHGNKLLEKDETYLINNIKLKFPQIVFVDEISNETISNVCTRTFFLPNVRTEDAFYEFKKILEKTKKRIVLWVGLSDTKECLATSGSEAQKQAQEMLSFYFYEPQGGVFSFKDLNEIIDLPMFSLTSFENQIHKAIWKKDLEQIDDILRNIKKLFMSEPRRFPRKVKHRISSMIVSFIKELEGSISEKQYDETLNQAYQLFAECDSFQQLFDISKELLHKVINCLTQGSKEYDPVEECIIYIKEHLNTDLSLKKVADQMHFHPNYLSGLMKNKVGLTYSSYILKLRMELASKLLKETNLKVQEIGFKCGFRDSNYFNRLFRREFKTSPEQYRRRYKIW